MRKIVFDIETKNFFHDVGKYDASLLDLALIAIHDSDTDEYTSYLEKDLPNLWPILEQADLLIGYNSDHFDIPLLNKYYPGDLTTIKSIDLLKEIKNATGKRFKLDTVADATLGEKKSGDGLLAHTWWKKGEVDKVRDYCIQDVRLTKKLYDFARRYNTLKYKDMGGIKEIRLDTTPWEEIPKTGSVTRTLPF